MLALRYAAVLALLVWVGGLFTLGAVVAPSAFDVLGAGGGDGRVLAGAVFGETLRRFHLVSYGCAAVLLASLMARGVLGPRPRRFAIRLVVAGMMVGSSAWIGQVIAPQIVRAQRDIGVAPSSLPEGDARRALFARLHRSSTALQLIPVIGGLLLLWWELRD
jgi:uncharacterized protein DUF4149